VNYENVSDAAHATLRAGGAFRSQLEMVRKGGERIWVDVSGLLLAGPQDQSIWFLADISELKRYQESFERMAHVDALTGLPNRVLMADRMEQALALARRHQYGTAVCYVDLDGFKDINDSHGHANGDVLLEEVARRMDRTIRHNDTAARLGGDEFVLLLTHVESTAEIEHLLERVLAEISRPVRLQDGREVRITASIGVALSPQESWDAQELLRRADTAMYAAKRMGKNKVHFYRGPPAKGSPPMH
jgi:diguanylate cyclase (GGDEF)-like protein